MMQRLPYRKWSRPRATTKKILLFSVRAPKSFSSDAKA